MSKTDFSSASFRQDTSDTAASREMPHGTDATESAQENELTLSGLMPPKMKPIFRMAEQDEAPPSSDQCPPPAEVAAPMLPGMAETVPDSPTPVVHIAAQKSPLKLRPPAQRRAACAEAANGHAKKPLFRFNAIHGLSALSGVLGLGLLAALVCPMLTPEPPAAPIPNDIPLALLPKSADPALWETVSRMHGEIDGTILAFERGLATDAAGNTYKVQLDFCRNGADIYAKVAGEKLYVVRLDAKGNITKVFPAPKNSKPLKEILGK